MNTILRSSIRLLFFTAFFAAAARASDRPNIVLIMADDMGWSDIGCYGSEIATPNIDRLAAEGLRFTQFYNNAKCTTTRASLLTGLYPRNGGRGISELLRKDMVTIGEAMLDCGYATGLSGKWHNGGKPGERPFDRGFEEAYGLWDGCCNFFDPSQPDPRFKGGRVRVFGHNDEYVTEFPDDFYATDAFSDHAVETIRRHARSGQPFLHYIAHTAPHYPIHARPADIAKYDGVYDEGWEVLAERRHAKAVELGLVDPAWKRPAADPEVEPWEKAKHKEWQTLRMETYAAMIDSMDQGIGKVLDVLDDLGIADNTLVLFLSDNGSCAEQPGGETPEQVPGPKEFYSHVGPSWAYAQNSPFRRYKSRSHEGGCRTPLVARWPGKIDPGSITAEVGHVIDFLPTFLEMGEGSYPAERGGEMVIPVEGLSLVPIFDGEGREAHTALFWNWSKTKAVRMGDWKLVWDDRKTGWELYDLGLDGTETNNLAEAHPERVEKMAARWEEWARMTQVIRD